MRKDRKPSLGRAATRGAIAGLIGGAAMTTAERVLLPRLPGRHAPRVAPWDARVADAADTIGWDMTPRSRTAAGITTQLMYTALLGAAYAAIMSRKPSRAGCDLVDAALVYGASLIAGELPRSKRRKKGSRLTRLGSRAAEPITVPKVFGRATTMALRAMERVS
jgi:hypothetical protein